MTAKITVRQHRRKFNHKFRYEAKTKCGCTETNGGYISKKYFRFLRG